MHAICMRQRETPDASLRVHCLHSFSLARAGDVVVLESSFSG
jgi:hypothetical protein